MLVDERYMREQHVSVDDDWNYVHNLMYAVANLLEEGKIKEAEQLSGKLSYARGELPSTMYVFSARDSIARLNPGLPVALRIAAWPQISQLLNGGMDPAQPNLRFLKRSLSAIATGMQAIERRDLDAADESTRRLDSELWETSESLKGALNAPQSGVAGEKVQPPQLQVRQDALAQPLVGFLSIMSLEMRGSVLLLKGKTDEGKQLFASAEREERQLGYREPPQYIRPVGESEGAALLAIHDWSGARAAYAEALAERPHSGFALFGLAMCSEGAGDVTAAAAAYREFLVAWRDADSGSPENAHAEAYLTAHKEQLIAQ